MALVDSVLVVLTILIIDYLSYHTRSMMTALGVFLGLAWHVAFDQAVEGIEEKFAQHDIGKQLKLKLGMTFGLCLVVLPAWWQYILPRAMEADLKEQNEPNSEWAAPLAGQAE